VSVNADLRASTLDEVVPMARGAAQVVEKHVRSGALSARGFHRVHRLARTVADLDGVEGVIEEAHVREALLLRSRRELLLGTESR
jgi:magnesium chelatase family protein